MPPKRLAREKIYQSPWVNLYTDKVRMNDGTIIEKYHYLDIPLDAVGVVVENNDEEILLVNLDRYITNNNSWEISGGAVEKGESILTAAKRETEEETGFEITEHRHIHSYHPNNGISNATFHIVFAKTSKSISQAETDEVNKINFFPKGKVEEMIKTGAITNGLSLTALLFYFYKKDHKR